MLNDHSRAKAGVVLLPHSLALAFLWIIAQCIVDTLAHESEDLCYPFATAQFYNRALDGACSYEVHDGNGIAATTCLLYKSMIRRVLDLSL